MQIINAFLRFCLEKKSNLLHLIYLLGLELSIVVFSPQTMGVSDFTDMVACFLRVAWAAAAGKLHLASVAQPMKENNSLYTHSSSRSRQSSTG